MCHLLANTRIVKVGRRGGGGIDKISGGFYRLIQYNYTV